jgi:hypothetical protein
MATPTRKSAPRRPATGKDAADKGITPTARGLSKQALHVLAKGLEGNDMRIALACAKEVIGHGKALAVSADLSQRLDGLDDETLDAAIDAIRTALGAAAGVGDGAAGEAAPLPAAPLSALP